MNPFTIIGCDNILSPPLIDAIKGDGTGHKRLMIYFDTGPPKEMAIKAVQLDTLLEQIQPTCLLVASSYLVVGEGIYQCPSCEKLVYHLVRSQIDLDAHRYEPICRNCAERMDPLPAPETYSSPTTQYGLAKLHEEQWALYWGKRMNILTYVLRFSEILTDKYLRYLSTATLLDEDGGMSRDWLSVNDAVGAIQAVLHSDLPGGVYNVAGASRISHKLLAECVGNTSCKGKPYLSADKDTETLPRHAYASVKKISPVWKPTDFTVRNLSVFARSSLTQ